MFSKTIPTLTLSIVWIASVLALGTVGFTIANSEGDAGFITASIQGEGDTGF